MRVLLLCTIVFFTLPGCEDKEDQPAFRWEKLGLDGKTVNDLQYHGDILFVATNDGLYQLEINGSADFTLIGFEGKNVQSMVVFSETNIMVSVVDKTTVQAPTLHSTNDQGATWNTIDNNFGGDYDEAILDMAPHPDYSNILYATGSGVVAKSIDYGETWTPIWGDWGGFGTGTDVLGIDPADNEIWAGGQGGIENGYLVRSKNESEWDEWNDLVENPTVVKAITFDPANSGHIYAGYEGALMRTRDDGTTWETLIDSEENRFFFGVSLSETFENRIYTAGWLKRFDDPQPLKLFYSDNSGSSWNERSFANEDFGGVYDMQIKKGTNEDVLFLGLYKGGLYRLTVKK
jgi:hypothetical protein